MVGFIFSSGLPLFLFCANCLLFWRGAVLSFACKVMMHYCVCVTFFSFFFALFLFLYISVYHVLSILSFFSSNRIIISVLHFLACHEALGADTFVFIISIPDHYFNTQSSHLVFVFFPLPFYLYAAMMFETNNCTRVCWEKVYEVNFWLNKICIFNLD